MIFSLARWDAGYFSTTFALAKEISKDRKVIYIDSPITLKDCFKLSDPIIRKRIVKAFFNRRKAEQISNNLIIWYPPVVIPINFLPAGKRYNFLRKINERRVFNSFSKYLQREKIYHYYYLNSFNPFYQHRNHLSPLADAYYTLDNINAAPYLKKHGSEMEKQIMKEVDFVLATSRNLQRLHHNFNENVYLLTNAADTSIFSANTSYQKPTILKKVDKTIQSIFYVGHFDARVDLDIIEALLNKEFLHLFILGPVSLDKEVYEELNNYSNCTFIGSKPLEEIPAYLSQAQCTIIPFKRNKLTAGIYPLKINEYLAMGKAVVATNFSEDIQLFKDIISLQDHPTDFVNAVCREIYENNSEKIKNRINIAQENTWNKRADQLMRLFSETEDANLQQDKVIVKI